MQTTLSTPTLISSRNGFSHSSIVDGAQAPAYLHRSAATPRHPLLRSDIELSIVQPLPCLTPLESSSSLELFNATSDLH